MVYKLTANKQINKNSNYKIKHFKSCWQWIGVGNTMEVVRRAFPNTQDTLYPQSSLSVVLKILNQILSLPCLNPGIKNVE